MDRRDKFKTVLQRAMDNRWRLVRDDIEIVEWYTIGTRKISFLVNHKDLIAPDRREYSINDVIFSKDFAKAFWGEGKIRAYSCGHTVPLNTEHHCEEWDDEGGSSHSMASYLYHLQQLVLQDNYIDYLYSFA